MKLCHTIHPSVYHNLVHHADSVVNTNPTCIESRWRSKVPQIWCEIGITSHAPHIHYFRISLVNFPSVGYTTVPHQSLTRNHGHHRGYILKTGPRTTRSSCLPCMRPWSFITIITQCYPTECHTISVQLEADAIGSIARVLSANRTRNPTTPPASLGGFKWWSVDSHMQPQHSQHMTSGVQQKVC